jgi:hypothetical protein
MAKELEIITLEDGTPELLPDYSRLEPVAYNVFRQDTDGGRYYVIQWYDEKNVKQTLYLPSCTTVISKSMPTPIQITKLMVQMGWDAFNYYVSSRQAYGTVMHTLISELFISKVIAHEQLKPRICAMINDIHPMRSSELAELANEMIKDLLSFAQFVVDHAVIPYSIEHPLASFRGRYCMAIDMLCTMRIEEKGFFGEVYKSGAQKDQPKETKRWRDVFAYVDFKSGKKGFFDTHELQLRMGQQVIEENYPGIAEHLTGSSEIYLFNWAPSDWKAGTPTYKLKDQRGQVSDEDMWARVQLGVSAAKKQIPARFQLVSDIRLGEDPASMFKYKPVEIG